MDHASVATRRGRPRWPALVLVAALVVVPRLPYLHTGYGTDTDAWSVARVARRLAATGVYEPSRVPGNPLQERLCALAIRWGDRGVNGLTLAWTAAAAVLLAMLLGRLGVPDAALVAGTFTFVPAVMVASVSGMDYLWAVAFLLAALRAALGGRPLLAGLLLGCAAGARITSIAFLVPLLIVSLSAARASRLRDGLVLGATALATTAAWFAPQLLHTGLGFLSYYEPAGGHVRSLGDFLRGMLTLWKLPFSPLLVAAQATVGVWGVAGTVALAIVIPWTILKGGPRGGAPPVPPLPRAVVLAAALAILITVALYLRLPDDEGYLIPAVPFTLLLIAARGPRGAVRALCVALLLAPFVVGVDAAPPKKGVTPLQRSPWARTFALGGDRFVLDPGRGPFLMDIDKRRAQDAILTRVRARWSSLPDSTVLIAGRLDLPFRDDVPPRPHRLLTFDLLGEAEVRGYVARGDSVLYLPDARERTRRFLGYSLDAAGAHPFFGPGS